MEDLACHLLAMNLFAHRAHHDVIGPGFFSDHSKFGDFYEAYDDAYDSVVERIKGLGGNPDLAKLAVTAAQEAAKYAPRTASARVLWEQMVKCEKELRQMCESCMKSASEGTKNLLAQLADDSEQRCFLVKGRLAV